MPPVRWKMYAITVIAIHSVQLLIYTDAQHMQEPISMTADGWKPIIGTHREQPPNYHKEITHYRNPNSHNSEIVKIEEAATLPPISTTQKLPTAPLINNPNPTLKGKIPPHSKQPQYYTVQNHGPLISHIPIGAVSVGRPNQIKKYPHPNKQYLHIPINGKRPLNKPIRLQPSAHSARDEIFVAAPPPNSGASYSYFTQGQNNIKTRETQLLAIPGSTNNNNNNFPHVEFSNRFSFPSTSESIYQPFNFVFPAKSNDIFTYQNQNDEFTRNLVPPPFYKKNKIKEKDAQQNVNTELPQFSSKPNVQLPLPYDQNKFLITNNYIPKKEQAVDVQVTKERLKVFHNNIPPSYKGEYIDFDYHTLRKPGELPKLQTYEVTEGKPIWPDIPPPIIYTQPQIKNKHPEIQLNPPPFLPTPYKPEGVIPTLPSQAEVSTIFTQVSSKYQNHLNPSFFNVKEVSTHFPILGKPDFATETKFENEITTITPTPVPSSPTRTRLTHRRRRPIHRTSTTTTEESVTDSEYYEPQKQNNDLSNETTEKPSYQHKRPHIRYRYTTTPPSDIEEEVTTNKPIRGKNRYRYRPGNRKRIRPIEATELPTNHKMTEVEYIEYQTTPSSLEIYKSNEEREEMQKYELPGRHYETNHPESEEEQKYELPGKHYETTPVVEENYKATTPSFVEEITIKQPQSVPTTTEELPTTNLHIPENEIDDAANSNQNFETVTTEVITTEPTSASTTTTTTTKPSRIRGRPIKYDNSNRPRFSVKDYRQRLNQYSSTSTTESSKNENTNKIRLPNRMRRPSTTATPTIERENDETETNTESIRNRFTPKDPRHGSGNYKRNEEENDGIITEKNVKSVNTRLRPFGRYRSTTSTTSTTPRVTIKSNLFNRRRPPSVSLRSRIYNRYNKTNNEDKPIKIDSESESMLDIDETTLENIPEEATISYGNRRSSTIVNDNMEIDTTTSTTDILKNEAFMYSQRVSELTSQSKNDYDTPGLFKSVSPTSRRIPSYFTIATDDPILPIEAFFPNLKDKDKDN